MTPSAAMAAEAAVTSKAAAIAAPTSATPTAAASAAAMTRISAICCGQYQGDSRYAK
jgi:hypothetical protein